MYYYEECLQFYRFIWIIDWIDRERNIMLRSMTGIAYVESKIAKLKWEWAGDVSQMQPEKCANVITPLGTRRRKVMTGTFWEGVEGNRQRRGAVEDFVETFAQMCATIGY